MSRAATTAAPSKALRGFARMDSQRRREIAAEGGRTAHRNGTAHRFTSQEAAAASLARLKKRS